jgi:hypothetical protein
MATGQRVINGETYGGIQDVRGVPTFIHSKQQAGSYERILENITPQVIENVLGQNLDSALAAQINENENYKVRNIGGDKYVIEYGELGDAVVMDTDGDPIIFKGQDLIDAMVPVPGIMEMPRQPRTGETITGQKRGDEFVEILEDEPPTGMFRGAEEAIAPSVPTEQMRTVEPEQTFRKRGRLSEQSIRKQIEEAGLPPSQGQIALPLLKSVPDSVSDEEYIEYMDAVFGGFRKPFKDWKASQ